VSIGTGVELLEVLRALLLGRATDLTDHDDAYARRISVMSFSLE
jgi:hypothetical protein